MNSNRCTTVFFVGTILVALSVFHCDAAPGADTPPGQKKIVFVLKGPDLPITAIGALPKTMYLAGEYYARIEQPAELTSGKQNLLIVRGRDVWVIDILKKTGTHSINSSPDFTVHNPILGPNGPSELFEFEYGREVAFFEKTLTKQLGPEKIEGVECLGREVTAGNYRVVLYTNRTKSPVKVQVFRNANMILEIKYLSYEEGLPFDRTLFQPPEGIDLVESVR